MDDDDSNISELERACIYKFDKTLLHVEYPGLVLNVKKAIETLGGVDKLEKSLHGAKLELSFHPKNQYMKGCCADQEHNIGLLLSVKKSANSKVSYEIIGVSDTSVKFNRMCDFQYLPLQPKEKPEHKDSEVDFVHYHIVPEKLPTLDWFQKKDLPGNSAFLQSGTFARFDLPQNKFNLNTLDAFNSMVRSDAPNIPELVRRKEQTRHIPSSIRWSPLKETDVPKEPPANLLTEVQKKFPHYVALLQKLFEERPMWTKAAIMCKCNILLDTFKNVIPAVAYYCSTGAWRACWIKFGYNPLTDFNSRIYQILDCRIRHNEGVHVGVKPKRTWHQSAAKDFTEKQTIDIKSEQNFIIRPNQIPSARQMLYQFTDILLPEIEDMIAKLPKLSAQVTYDSRSGWLPPTFADQCRDIVNKYVFQAVQRKLQAKQTTAEEAPKDTVASCSRLLSGYKTGFHFSQGRSIENVIAEIDLSDDEQEEIDSDTVIASLPDRLPDSLNDDEPDEEEEEEECEIDMETLQEIDAITKQFCQE